MAPFKRNPAWSTRAIAESYDFLEEQVRPEWLPKFHNVRGAGRVKMAVELREFGCGAYGCVLETLDPKVVMKITTDKTEAEFASQLSHLSKAVVAYYQAIRLPNEREGRPMFLVWRESAQHVGELEQVLGAKAKEIVNAQHQAAQVVYDCGERGDVTSKTFDRAIEAWKATVAEFTKVPALAFLAKGLLELLWTHGVFMGDLHANNLGMVTRAGRTYWVVTDPGHTLVIEPSAVPKRNGGADQPARPAEECRCGKRITQDPRDPLVWLDDTDGDACMKGGRRSGLAHWPKAWNGPGDYQRNPAACVREPDDIVVTDKVAPENNAYDLVVSDASTFVPNPKRVLKDKAAIKLALEAIRRGVTTVASAAKARTIVATLSKLPVVYNGRLMRMVARTLFERSVTRAGFVPVPTGIEFTTIELPADVLATTLVHEFAHAATCLLLVTSTGGHGREWASLMRASGEAPDEFCTDPRILQRLQQRRDQRRQRGRQSDEILDEMERKRSREVGRTDPSPPPEMSPDIGTMWCTRCGTQLPSDSTFCGGCGVRVRLEEYRRNPAELDAEEAKIESEVTRGMGVQLYINAITNWQVATNRSRGPVIPTGNDLRAVSQAAHDLARVIAQVEQLGAAEYPMSFLYQRAMEAHQGVGFTVEESPAAKARREALEQRKAQRAATPTLYLDSNRGMYIAHAFATETKPESISGVSKRLLAILHLGPNGASSVNKEYLAQIREMGGLDPNDEYVTSGDAYSDAWDEVLNSAIVTDSKGVRFTLWNTENGDIFLIPEGMELDDDEEWVWPFDDDEIPNPDNIEDDDQDSPYNFGRALAMMATGGGDIERWWDDHAQFDLEIYTRAQRGTPVYKVTFDGTSLAWEG